MESVTSPNSASARPLGVFIVEDSPIVRGRIEEMLAEIPGAFPAGFASAAGQAIQKILECHPNVVLLDMQLAQGSGLDVLRTVRPQRPATVFYMFSNFSTLIYRRIALQLGAAAYYDKTSEIGDLRNAIAVLASQSVH
ncbi:MAG: response regulator [Burkholderiales bacterium]